MQNGEPTNTATEQEEAVQGLSRAAAARFVEKWKNAKDEKQESNLFWHSFFIDLLGITDLQAAGVEFEKRVISSKKGTTNYIDVFWKDTFLAEQKSAGKDLDAAEAQAREYVVSLPPALRPPIVIVSDFARFRIVDVLRNQTVEFPLTELPENIDRLEGIVHHKTTSVTRIQVEADQKAAQLMADLYILALFMLLQSRLFTAWVATVSSRLESRFCISASSVYNTFPFPELSESTKEKLRDFGRQVLELRTKYGHVSLGDLYDPELMPVDLLKVHQASDKEILKSVGLKGDSTETEMLEKLFESYTLNHK